MTTSLPPATSLAVVRARLAEAVAPVSDTTRLGTFTLRRDQREAVARVVRALRRHGGALLADPPGAGKTITALAVADAWLRSATPETRVVVLAPAALREQWLHAAHRAARPVLFVSLESLSRQQPVPDAALCIVDEAHRLGRPGTNRHRAVARTAVRMPALLLTATPVVNRAEDRDALLGLFLAPPAVHDESIVRETIIRRESVTDTLPRRRRIALLDIATVPFALAQALRQLPPPYPVADGVAATALVRVTLAMAWRSSLAALDAALRRRASRGQRLADALAQGEWPTRQQLHEWIGDGDLEQLALPLMSWAVTPAPAGALAMVRAHVDAVRALRERLAPLVPYDTMVRAHALLRLANRYPGQRIVCFAQHAETIGALWNDLCGEPGVVAIAGQHVHAAAGRWSRADVLAALGQQARPYRPDDLQGIRLLLTTDLLAEGVELPGASIVVHGDMPWTPARIEQREGRLRRPGNARATVLVTGFPNPTGIKALLALGVVLRQKREARTLALAVARQHARLGARMAEWHVTDQRLSRAAGAVAPSGPAVAAVTATMPGFVAVYTMGGATHACAGIIRHHQWRLAGAGVTMHRVLAAVTGTSVVPDPTMRAEVAQALTRYLERQQGRALLGPTTSDRRHALWSLRLYLQATVRAQPLHARPAMASRVGALLARAQQVQGIGALREIRDILRVTPAADRIAALEAAMQSWRVPHAQDHAPPRVESVLLLQPASGTAPKVNCAATPSAPAPPAASPESAAPR